MLQRLKSLWNLWHHLDALRGLVEVILLLISAGSVVVVILAAALRIVGDVSWLTLTDGWWIAVIGVATTTAVAPWLVLAPRLRSRQRPNGAKQALVK